MGIDMKNESVAVGNEATRENERSKYRGGAVLFVVSGIAAIAAGVATTVISKKRARQYLAMHGHDLEEIPESGTALALKALCYSTLITLGAFSISIFGLCKLFDIKSMDDLRTKIRQTRKQTSPDPNERTEFESLTDFLNYINERYGKPEAKKS
ncbi:UNVERIFIED_CONTAM: hypothetical protein PYX00_008848 [Menopon gallinae]|uniref:Transmembrane protein 242 n=1 Tax=Menopon gallinae TaxID=328185 RepID=A0AAW2H988_9NEOP